MEPAEEPCRAGEEGSAPGAVGSQGAGDQGLPALEVNDVYHKAPLTVQQGPVFIADGGIGLGVGGLGESQEWGVIRGAREPIVPAALEGREVDERPGDGAVMEEEAGVLGGLEGPGGVVTGAHHRLAPGGRGVKPGLVGALSEVQAPVLSQQLEGHGVELQGLQYLLLEERLVTPVQGQVKLQREEVLGWHHGEPHFLHQGLHFLVGGVPLPAPLVHSQQQDQLAGHHQFSPREQVLEQGRGDTWPGLGLRQGPEVPGQELHTDLLQHGVPGGQGIGIELQGCPERGVLGDEDGKEVPAVALQLLGLVGRGELVQTLHRRQGHVDPPGVEVPEGRRGLMPGHTFSRRMTGVPWCRCLADC